jgi:hypothetical protein
MKDLFTRRQCVQELAFHTTIAWPIRLPQLESGAGSAQCARLSEPIE